MLNKYSINLEIKTLIRYNKKRYYYVGLEWLRHLADLCMRDVSYLVIGIIERIEKWSLTKMVQLISNDLHGKYF